MFSISHFLIGLVMAGLGVVMVKYTFKMVTITGRQDWLEKYTGQGTTYGVFKLFGVLLVIVGILFATGFGTNFMDWLFSPLKSIFPPINAHN